MKVTGTITKILEKVSGKKKDGSGEWCKQTFVLDNGEKYSNIFAFEVFGDEKVENLTKYNKVNDTVEVEFNVSTNEYQGRYYTTLQAWKISKAKDGLKNLEETFDTIPAEEVTEETDDLPF